MEINLSEETIKTVYNSLKDSRLGLRLQLQKSVASIKKNKNKEEIIKFQLDEVEDALAVFEELMEVI